ncbi:MAG: glycosyltransferase, partial [Chloroflexota bacterium]|nr:glycosyltransferase [Chloroflexota bacterium]
MYTEVLDKLVAITTAHTEQVDSQSGHLLTACPLCQSRRLYYAFSHHNYRLVRCAECHLMMLNPQYQATDQAAFVESEYFLGANTSQGRAEIIHIKRATARSFLQQLERYRGALGGKLLQIGCGEGDFLVEAQHAGYDVVGIEPTTAAAKIAQQRVRGNVICGSIDHIALREASFDVCVLSEILERVANPLELLRTARRLLKKDGVLFIVVLSLDSWPARLFRQSWMGFKPDHLTYFDTNTIQHALFKTGFNRIITKPIRKVLNVNYIQRYFERYPVRLLTPLVQGASRSVPQSLRTTNISVVTSGVAVFSRPSAVPEHRTLSVVVPAYNEAATFEVLMDALLRKEVPGLKLEIIIVESNSTDGTREIAQRYKDHPRVRLVLQDRPQGKGYAVRTGFEHATGDFILIQDADLEYDPQDWPVLLEPLLSGKADACFGSRFLGGPHRV